MIVEIIETVALVGPAVTAVVACVVGCFPEVFSKHIPEVPENEIEPQDNTIPFIIPSDTKTVYRLDDLMHS